MTDVYSPNEDSLFLLKSVEGVPASRVAEIGIGSGFVLSHYVLNHSPSLAVGTDVDIGALKVTSRRNGADSIELVQCEACEGFREGAFNLIFFNPPYLRDEGTQDLATSGGSMGIEVTHFMVRSSLRTLVSKGRMIFIVSSLADMNLLRSRLRREGVTLRRRGRMRLFFEELYSMGIVKRGSSRRLR